MRHIKTHFFQDRKIIFKESQQILINFNQNWVIKFFFIYLMIIEYVKRENSTFIKSGSQPL